MQLAALPDSALVRRGLKTGQECATDPAYCAQIRRVVRYPTAALRAQLEGTVRVQLTVSAAGYVTAATLLEAEFRSAEPLKAAEESAARQAMQEAAVYALRRLRFVPGKAGTEIVALSYRFRE
ncbi:energy transducer TonB [Hymenobacter sp. B81]|uniref:energy transducer TonB n=1 Tax=Hymenobacter sp. B81 TaxID=3344878 RepID=UPI0037DD6CB3